MTLYIPSDYRHDGCSPSKPPILIDIIVSAHSEFHFFPQGGLVVWVTFGVPLMVESNRVAGVVFCSVVDCLHVIVFVSYSIEKLPSTRKLSRKEGGKCRPTRIAIQLCLLYPKYPPRISSQCHECAY